MSVRIERLMEDLKKLGSIGFVPGKGANRMAYSKNFYEGRDFVRKKMEEAGLMTCIDAVGNLTGVLPSSTGRCKQKIAMGSHIDTLQNGVNYDGALGVLGADEAVRVLREEGWKNDHPIEIIAFNEEEGNVVGGTFGSKAFAGAPLEESMIKPMAERHISREDFASCKRNKNDYLVYLEYHIEQGGILESEGKTIGIAEGIFGILRYKATVRGDANHAGSTPMRLRNDAMEKTCRIITDLMDSVRETGNTMVCTVGTMSVTPGAVNVIPGETQFIIELRDKSMNRMYDVIKQLLARWKDKGLSVEEFIKQPETVCSPQLCEIVEKAAEELDYSSMRMYSGAGHDLINMSFLVPSALIFIPSRNGISHRFDEYSDPDHIRDGAEVLLRTLQKIDRGAFE